MGIAKYVNSRQIAEMFLQSGIAISYQRACKIKKELKEMHKDVLLPDERVIPEKWVLDAYSEKAYK